MHGGICKLLARVTQHAELPLMSSNSDEVIPPLTNGMIFPPCNHKVALYSLHVFTHPESSPVAIEALFKHSPLISQ